MAEYLASIYGTEKDKVNCSFYFKIGACRHGDRCSRLHNKPKFSQTILIANMYQNPTHITGNTLTEEQLQLHFEQFYEDVFTELSVNYGEIEEMYVCDNVGDHLIGNVYVRFRYEEDAQKAVDSLNNRFYAGRPLWAELSPVSDFREACCRQYEKNECTRGGFCNFMHLKVLNRKLKHELYAYGRPECPQSALAQRAMLHMKPDPRGRARSRTPEDARSYSPGRGGGRGDFGRDRSRSPPGHFAGGRHSPGGGRGFYDDRYGPRGPPPPPRGYGSPRGDYGRGGPPPPPDFYPDRDRDRDWDRDRHRDRDRDRGRGGPEQHYGPPPPPEYGHGHGGPPPEEDPYLARARIADQRYVPAGPPGAPEGFYGPPPPHH